MGTDRARAFSHLKYYRPRELLLELRRIEMSFAPETPAEIRHLRTSRLKPLRELREAALFCHGWEQLDGQAFGVAHAEAQDHDAVATWESDHERHFAPIQIKETVPAHLNAEMTVQDCIDGLRKYVDSEDLTVVIHVNREIKSFAPSELLIPPLKIAALWILAGLAPDQSRWLLFGNLLETPRWGEFTYPT